MSGKLREQLADVIRAEIAGKDLADGSHGLHVYAMRKDKSLYELGSVRMEVVAQSREEARRAIELIKFHPC